MLLKTGAMPALRGCHEIHAAHYRILCLGMEIQDISTEYDGAVAAIATDGGTEE